MTTLFGRDGRRNTYAPLRRPARIHPHAIDQQMQIRIIGQRQQVARAGAVQQPLPHRIDHRTAGQHRRAYGSCGGRSHPELAFWNSQRLPSSR